jgi:hypothetical protein
MNTATLITTTPKDEQHDRIYAAFQHAAGCGWLSTAYAAEIECLKLQPEFVPSEEFRALEILSASRCRPRLKKLGLEFSTKGQYRHRLRVEPQGDGAWLVRNLTRETQYTVTERGFALDCSCDEFGNGFCKHRDAVDEYRSKSHVEASPGIGSNEAAPRIIAADGGEATVIGDAPEVGDSVPECDRSELLPGIIPTADQWAALQALKRWYFEGTEPFFVLKGFAGTGKTTIIQAFIQDLKATAPRMPSVGFAAPTNKAAKVQRKMLSKWGLSNIEPMTCAKLFAIKEKKVDGKQVFVRDRNETPAVEMFELVIVDEGSMISEDLWQYFLEETGDFFHPKRFVFMGDPAQLPPVGEPESYVFRHRCSSAELRQVMRYGGAIGELAHRLRDDLAAPLLPTVETQIDAGGQTGIWALDRASWEATMVAAFQSEGYLRDPNYCRALAWRNKRVDYLNATIRRALGRVGDYAVGERLIANEPYAPGEQVLIANSEEAEVRDCREGTIGDWGVWWLTLDVEDKPCPVTVPVLQSRELPRFTVEQNRLSKAKDWGRFWRQREQFAWLRYAYCLTVHKSQGSTFTHGFVDFPDIAANRARHTLAHNGAIVYERNQLAYVGATRFTDRLFPLQ